jgi:DNA modification methylase
MTHPLSTRRRWEIKHSDCLDALPKLDPSTIDAIITDPPYGIAMSGMTWDQPKRLDPARPPGRRRPRTSPSVAFQRFCHQWGSECLRTLKPGAHLAAFSATRTIHLLTSGLEEAGFEIRDMLMWVHGQGFPASRQLPRGLATALRPAVEPIILARKPYDGTLNRNLTKHGTGALNIDACRMGRSRLSYRPGSHSARGRWPTNVMLSHGHACTPALCQRDCPVVLLGDNHRLFFCAKPSRRQREAGCGRLPRHVTQTFKLSTEELRRAEANPVANIHPTVKPLDLMRWLVRLLTPPPRERSHPPRPVRRQRLNGLRGRPGGRPLPRYRARRRLRPDSASPDQALGQND